MTIPKRLRPIPIKDRASMVFLGKGELDVRDGAFVLIDNEGVRVQIPIGIIVCILLEPGTRVSHAAVALAAKVGTLLVWVGEGGVRLYSSGRPGGARSDRLLYQAQMALDPTLRLKVIGEMYRLRFGEEPPSRRSPEQLRGMEGARVRSMYSVLAKRYGITWYGRRYTPGDWNAADPINRALSGATASLYGITEAAILAAGYSPAIGFLHTGKPLSFVYDIADIFKFESVVPIAFKVISEGHQSPEREVRIRCRDYFKQSRLLKKLVPTIEDILAAGGIERPKTPDDALPIAIKEEFPEP